MQPPETNAYFGAPPRLYGTFHHSASDPKANVLWIPPFGEERKCSYRLMAQTARRLAADGFHVLRFDLSGNGESLGAHDEVDAGKWVADIQEAATAMQANSSAAKLIVVGVRSGANLLLQCKDLATEAMILWEPLLDGQTYLDDMIRRKQIKEMKSVGKALSSPEALGEQWAKNEAVDFDGFAVSAELADGFKGLALTNDLNPPPASRILLIHITGSRRLSPPWAELEAQFAESANCTFQLIRDKPFWGRLDDAESEELMDATLDFCNAC